MHEATQPLSEQRSFEVDLFHLNGFELKLITNSRWKKND